MDNYVYKLHVLVKVVYSLFSPSVYLYINDNGGYPHGPSPPCRFYYVKDQDSFSGKNLLLVQIDTGYRHNGPHIGCI